MSKADYYVLRAGKVVLLDLDHTISNAFWRDGIADLVMAKEATWDDYHNKLSLDLPIWPMVHMIQSLYRDQWFICAITARPEKFRQITMQWLFKYDIYISELLMRPDENFRPATEIKMELVRERWGSQFTDFVKLVIDDRDDICKMFNGHGITTLQVRGVRDENCPV
jgi:hypothetical protein